MREVKELSEEMRRCLSEITEHGKIVRYTGGFWAQEGLPVNDLGSPQMNGESHYFSFGTIRALVERLLIRVDREDGQLVARLLED